MTKAINERVISIIAFSLFGAWLLSFAYEGQILYALFDRYHFDPGQLILGAILAHAAGLFFCGFIAKNITAAKKLLFIATAVCIAGSAVFILPPSGLWSVSLIVVSFFAGLWNASWGYFYRYCSLQNQRMSTVAASIAGCTTLMIGLNLAAIYISPYVGLGLAVLCLVASLFFTGRLPERVPEETPQPAPRVALRGPLVLLCLFIIVVTINSGLMFQVVNPAFAHLTMLTSWYWAVPYIAALIVVAWLPKKINRSYILFAAIAMMGFGFIAFFVLDRSASSYLVVNTLLLGAFGINDLFWWSILGEILDYHKNPAKILGIGLSVNVAGVLLGELLSGLISSRGDTEAPSLFGLAMICVALIILPPLYKQLTALLKSSSFLATMEALPPEEKKKTIEGFVNASELTDREKQIAALLLKGYTYRLIAQELFISESTVKTHIQNIYYKLGVRGKTEFIQKLMK